MPETNVRKRAKRAKAAGKSPSTQAGEFVREEMHHLREGRHGKSSPEQAIAIGLAKARRAGVDLPPGPPETKRRRTKRAPARTGARKRKRKRKRAKGRARSK